MKVFSNTWRVGLLALFASMSVVAADWDVDPSYWGGNLMRDGAAGRSVIVFDNSGTSFTDEAIKILKRTDGKYIVVGRVSMAGGLLGIGLTRLLANGTLDTTFGTAGKVSKEACMSSIKDAALDSQNRIIVVGQSTACSGNGTTDGAIVRFTQNGADDTSFAGDGGLVFKFNAAFDGQDDVAAVVIDTLDRIIVGGSLVTSTVRSARVMRFTANGGPDVPNSVAGPVFTTDSFIVDGELSSFGSTVWLIGRESDPTLVAVVWKLTGSLANDTSLATGGTAFLSVNHAPGPSCGLATDYTARALVRFGTTVKIIGNNGNRTWWAGVDETGAAGKSFGCFPLPSNVTAINLFSVTTSGDANGSLYAAGACINASGSRSCLWRFDKLNATDLRVDTTFNGGLPTLITYPKIGAVDADSLASDVLNDGSDILIAGLRVWNGSDWDFATARFGGLGPDVFRNGFE